MKIKQITENTTAGSIATVETSLGGTQSRGNPSIYGGKKVGTLFKGKKTKAPYANSINESAELSEAQLEEDDVIVVPGQGRSRKNGFVPHGQSRVDHEVEMARSDLFSAAKNAQQVYSMIKDISEDEGLDGWVQEKIIKANDYLNTIREYLEGKQVQGVTENNQRGDSLVTDALKIMRGSDYQMDPVRAIKTVLGEREYNSRRGFYNFYVKQLRDMYDQEGVAEGSRNAYLKHNNLVDIEKPLAGLKSEFEKFLQTHDPKEKQKYQQGIKQRIKSEPMLGPKGVLPEQGVAKGYQLDEGAVETITALVKKIPGIGKYYQMAQQYKPQLIQILKTSKSGKEVKQKMEQLAASQSVPVAESGMMKQLGGLAVGGGSILSTMWMNAMGMIDGVLAHAAAGEVGGAVASGSILGLIPVTLMLFAAMLLFKGSQQSSNEKAQAFQAQRGQQGMAEGKRNLKCVCKTHGTMQCPVHTPKDIEVIEGAKVDRMVKHVAQSEKKLGHSKKEAENIAWATANKRGMLDNKNKKA